MRPLRTRRRQRPTLHFAFALAALTGCGTIKNFDDDGLAEPYGGTLIDAQMIGKGEMSFLPYLDLPISIALDTATLPYTIPATLIEAE